MIPFFTVNTLDMTALKDKNTVVTYGFQFGIPSLSTAKYKDIAKDKCLVEVNYKFKFTGLQILLYPLIKFLIPKWNRRTWLEDLPLKERRQKVLKLNFKDFRGLPDDVDERVYDGEVKFNIPVPRPKSSTRDLHPLNNKN